MSVCLYEKTFRRLGCSVSGDMTISLFKDKICVRLIVAKLSSWVFKCLLVFQYFYLPPGAAQNEFYCSCANPTGHGPPDHR